jgi:hypothetical protein
MMTADGTEAGWLKLKVILKQQIAPQMLFVQR